MCILALALRERGVLAQDTLVATVMSNLGMLQAMDREGVVVRQTGVGDRYVLEDMKAGGYSLGGEQSGHVIFLDHGTTGDGVLTGLMLASRVAQTGRTLADLAAVMTRLPQVLVNVKDVDKDGVEGNAPLQAAVAEAERELNGAGRVLLASRALSRSCGSWSRRPTRSRPRRWRTGWLTSSKPSSRSPERLCHLGRRGVDLRRTDVGGGLMLTWGSPGPGRGSR